MRRLLVRFPAGGPAPVAAAVAVAAALAAIVPPTPALGQPPAARPSAIEGIKPGSPPPLAYLAVKMRDRPVTKVWVTRDDVRPLARPRADSPPASNGKYPVLAFLQGARITAESGGFLLLAEPPPPGQVDEPTEAGATDLFGWVPASKVMRDKALEDPKTKIPRQCLLINTVDRRGVTHIDRILKYRTRPAPAEDVPTRGSDILRALGYVYAEEGGDEDGWVLLGRGPRFSPQDSDRASAMNAKEIVRGWVPRVRTLPVATREYLDWDVRATWPEDLALRALPRALTPGRWLRREPRGRIYLDDLEGARKALTGQAIGYQFAEDFVSLGDLKVSRPRPPQSPRYPLMPIAAGASRPDGVPLRFQRDPSGNRLFRVACFGNLQADGQLVADPLITEGQARLEQIRDQMRTFQVLIVIDRTRSMEPYFEAVADFVDALVRSLEGRPRGAGERAIELAVSYYDDNQDGENGLQNELVSLDDRPAVDRMLAPLRRKPYTGFLEAVNNGPKELVFDGILKALARVERQFEARPNATRVLMVIGDQPDDDEKPERLPYFTPEMKADVARGTYDNPRKQFPNPAKGAEARIARALARPGMGTPTRLFAIQVIEPYEIPEFPDLSPRIFKTQMEEIIGGMNALTTNRPGIGDADSLGRYETLGGRSGQPLANLDEARKQDLLRRMTEQFRQLEVRAAELERQIQDLQDGYFTGARVDADLELLLKSNHFDPARYIEKSRANPTLTRIGYVWEYEPRTAGDPSGRDNIPRRGGMPYGRRQVRPVVLVTEGELQELKAVLDPFFRAFEQGRVDDPLEAVKAAIAAAVGNVRGMSIDDASRKRTGIAFESVLLKLPPEEMTREIVQENMPQLVLRYERIKDILDKDANGLSTRNVWRIVPGKQGGDSYDVRAFPHPEGRKVRRFYQPAGSVYQYCWLDQEEEMP